jgi:hypothetical protein
LIWAIAREISMDPSLISAIVAATAGQTQMAMAGKMLAVNLETSRSALKLIDAAQQSFASLANVSAGIGANFDTTA